MKNYFSVIGPYFELAARIYACAMLTAYGTGKLLGGQFYQNSIPPEVASAPLAEVGGFDLAWTFFGFSYGYILFIGGTQLIGAFLLLFERTKLLGVAMLVPVLTNIIVVDYFFSISTGAMLSAISYLLAICFVAYYNKEHILNAFRAILVSKSQEKSPLKIKLIKYGAAVFIVVLIILLENQMLNFVGR